MNQGLLDIINEQGEIIGQAPRDQIHREGLLHREINVWFYTPDGKIIFQHRSPDKQSAAGKLDATVGGHVEPGTDFLQTAVQEALEETGLTIRPQDLKLLASLRRTFHLRPDFTNNIISNAYSYRYDGKIEDLRVEPGQAQGFEAWPIQDLFTLSPEQAKRFVFPIFGDDALNIFRTIQQLVKEGSAA